MSDRVGQWQRVIAALESSGLSRAEFCRRRHLNYHTVTYWVRRFEQASGMSAHGGARRANRPQPVPTAAAGREEPSFLEVSLPAGRERALALNTPATYEVQLASGRSIRLGGDFDDGVLARLIQAAESC